MTSRRRLTLKDKLEIIVRQARCPLCGDKLGALEGIEFDHMHALARGGADTPDNIQAAHRACHRIKTSGKPATTRGSDVAEIAKTRRMAKSHEEFRARLLSPEPPQEKPKKYRWPKRAMRQKRSGTP